ncbi:hypothetical protein, partial [Solidesulfovibrio sp. C21]|uniref:hypothetical protein n=1 Tax=Solidesulfovibrio sp. C21 TaxID=3398613 RepID=UPI0039FBC3D3
PSKTFEGGACSIRNVLERFFILGETGGTVISTKEKKGMLLRQHSQTAQPPTKSLSGMRRAARADGGRGGREGVFFKYAPHAAAPPPAGQPSNHPTIQPASRTIQ